MSQQRRVATLRQKAGALCCGETQVRCKLLPTCGWPSVVCIIPLDAWNVGFLLQNSARGLGNKEDFPSLLIGTPVPLYHRRNMIKKDNLLLGKESSEFYISALILI